MTIAFTTDRGHSYVLDHGTKRYSHSFKGALLSEGSMLNSPPVVKGKKVAILTQPVGDTAVARVVRTGIVCKREVTFG